MKIVIFDIEVFQNYFLVLFKDIDTQKTYVFEIFNDKITEGSIGVCASIYNQCYLTGYNSNQFDIPLLDFVLKTKITDRRVYEKAQFLITSKQRVFNNNPKSIDLMELCFNVNPKSLKLIGCSLKMPKLQDLPLPYNSIITEEQIPLIRKYCSNDIDITEALYNSKMVQEALVIRKHLAEQNFRNILSKSDSGVANVIVAKWYSELTGLDEQEFKHLRTDRKIFSFSEAVNPDIANTLKTTAGKTIVKRLSELEMDSNKPKGKKIKYPNVKAFGLLLQYGAGGLHSKDASECYIATEDMELWDYDLTSQYPTYDIEYEVNPKHLEPVLAPKKREKRDERIQLKKIGLGKSSEANTTKLILNANVGKYKSPHSFLRDDLCNLQVTLNCQLIITRLVEILYCNNFKVISVNTDGLVTIVPKRRRELYLMLTKEFSDSVRFEGEYAQYRKYIRKDVNNYIAFTTTEGEPPKVKGIFDDKIYLEKGYKYPIIKIALKKYYVNNENIPIDEIIIGHKDIYDFCIAQKIGKQFSVYYGEEQIQQSVRAYVSTDGKDISKHKIVKDKKTGEDKVSVTTLLKDKKFTLFNDYFDSEDYKIDYDFYIQECKKIINKIKQVEI